MSKSMGHSTQMDYTSVVPSSSPACSRTTQRDMPHTTNTSGKKNIHSFSPKLRLLAVLCSNDIKEKKIIQNKLPKCYQQHGGKIPKISMKGQSKGTSIFSKKGRLIHAIQIITWLLSFSHKNLKGICLLLPLIV